MSSTQHSAWLWSAITVGKLVLLFFWVAFLLLVSTCTAEGRLGEEKQIQQLLVFLLPANMRRFILGLIEIKEYKTF